MAEFSEGRQKIMEKPIENKFIVSVSPHINSGRTTRGIMLDVIIALIPALIAGTVIFGLRSLLVVAVCVASCLAGETLFNLITRRPHTIGDLSAVVTGLILGLNLPSAIDIYPAVIGSLFAIIVVKCLFGGLGKNFANPAATARVFMLIAFTDAMTKVGSIAVNADAVASPTPLAVMKGAEGSVFAAAPSARPARSRCFWALLTCSYAASSPGIPPSFTLAAYSCFRGSSTAPPRPRFIRCSPAAC